MKPLTIPVKSGIKKLIVNNRLSSIPTLILIFLFANSCLAQNEAWYIESINQSHFGGRTEVSMTGGRADIVDDNYAIEVEFANKWKDAIGQSLWYGLQLERQPGIVLIMKTIQDRKYGIMLQSAIDYAGLTDKIKVWFYPEDFGIPFAQPVQKFIEERQEVVQTNGQYSYNKSSGIRHNSRCTYFSCKSCEPSSRDKGKGCGRCGG
jgi:hypothetical protein